MSSSGNAWDFGYSSGRVIPGSSGSPMFDSNKRIRGMASYIIGNYCNPSPDCYCATQYDHGYAKFSAAWNYIDQYLDPNNSGVTFIDGSRDGFTDVFGCSDPEADNYNPDANISDGSCEYNSGLWYVSTDGGNSCGSESEPLSSIQLAIDASADGDSILVTAGTYYENINFINFNLVIMSNEGAENTIINGGQNGSVITILNNNGDNWAAETEIPSPRPSLAKSPATWSSS